MWYTGRNQDDPAGGATHYGYRSLPLQLADRDRRFSQTVYAHLQARRVVDLRAHACDQDEPGWVLRGYDDRGRPLCEYGYPLQANGFDGARRRHQWVCQQACLQGREPQVRLPQVHYPPPECPYQAPEHRQGKVVNVGGCFPDGSWRLVRDLPVGSPTWKSLYHQGRNAVEGRNATLERWGLKRLPVYGQPRVTAWLFLADVWANLTTLARLIREATLVSARS